MEHEMYTRLTKAVSDLQDDQKQLLEDGNNGTAIKLQPIINRLSRLTPGIGWVKAKALERARELSKVS